MINPSIFIIFAILSLLLGNLIGFRLGSRWERNHKKYGDLFDLLINNGRGELSLFVIQCFDLKQGEYATITPYNEDNPRKNLLVRKYELSIRNEDDKKDRLFYLIISKHTVTGENRLYLSDASGHRLSFTDKQIHFLSNLAYK